MMMAAEATICLWPALASAGVCSTPGVAAVGDAPSSGSFATTGMLFAVESTDLLAGKESWGCASKAAGLGEPVEGACGAPGVSAGFARRLGLRFFTVMTAHCSSDWARMALAVYHTARRVPAEENAASQGIIASISALLAICSGVMRDVSGWQAAFKQMRRQRQG